MTRPARMLFACRIWRMGNSVVFPLPKLLREMMAARPDDLMLCRVHLPYVTFRIMREGIAVPVDNFGPEDLPPASLKEAREAEKVSE